MRTPPSSRHDQPASGPERLFLPPGSWRIVPEHSRVGFRVRKMRLYYVKGTFKAVNGSVEVGHDGLPIAGSLRIDASTVSTRIPPRDWHLRTRDFLAVKDHPEIRVGVDRAERASEERITVSAVVAIRGVEERIPLTAHSRAPEERRYGGRALHVSGTLDRHRFGIRPRRPVEWIVGREVRSFISSRIEART